MPQSARTDWGWVQADSEASLFGLKRSAGFDLPALLPSVDPEALVEHTCFVRHSQAVLGARDRYRRRRRGPGIAEWLRLPPPAGRLGH
jgi:hypothetical protein